MCSLPMIRTYACNFRCIRVYVYICIQWGTLVYCVNVNTSVKRNCSVCIEKKVKKYKTEFFQMAENFFPDKGQEERKTVVKNGSFNLFFCSINIIIAIYKKETIDWEKYLFDSNFQATSRLLNCRVFFRRLIEDFNMFDSITARKIVLDFTTINSNFPQMPLCPSFTQFLRNISSIKFLYLHMSNCQVFDQVKR